MKRKYQNKTIKAIKRVLVAVSICTAFIIGLYINVSEEPLPAEIKHMQEAPREIIIKQGGTIIVETETMYFHIYDNGVIVIGDDTK